MRQLATIRLGTGAGRPPAKTGRIESSQGSASATPAPRKNVRRVIGVFPVEKYSGMKRPHE
jgi:hypothetical protein